MGVVTVVSCGVEHVAVTRGPGSHANEVGDEGGDDALEDGRVTPDHVLLVYVRLVLLVHHYTGGEGGEGGKRWLRTVLITLRRSSLTKFNTVKSPSWPCQDRPR